MLSTVLTVLGSVLTTLQPTPASAATPTLNLLYANDSSGFFAGMTNWGLVGDRVLVGDWNGDRRDTVAVRRGLTVYFRDSLTSGGSNRVINYGRATDEVLVGDWNGDGRDTLGVRRGNVFLLADTLGASPRTTHQFSWGRGSDVVLVGDWNGDGRDTLALRRGATGYLSNTLANVPAAGVTYGVAGDRPLSGDWNGDGVDSLGVRRGNTYYLRDASGGGAANRTFAWGASGDVVVFGDWDGNRTSTPMAARPDNSRYQVWALTNAERAKAGRAALKYSDCLQIKYAQPWAEYMARTGDFRHQALVQRRCAKDLTGENIAAGYLTPAAVMAAWMNSPGHKENILRPQFTIMGVGAANSTDAYRKYWVQNFG